MYHISKKGEPEVCHASVKACPLGGDHYSSESEAYVAIEKDLGGPFGSMSSTLFKRPDFDVEKVSFSKRFSLNGDAISETKNRGEYSEIYGALYMLSEKDSKMVFSGMEPWKLESIVLGKPGDDYSEIKVVTDEDGDRDIYVKKNSDVVFVSKYSEGDLNLIFKEIESGSKTKSATTFHSKIIQDECVRIGFVNGKVPKAESRSKADLICWDNRGIEHRISVKSFIGDNPTLINASQSSAVSYSAPLPKNVSEKDVTSMIETAKSEGKSTREIISALKSKGISFDGENAEFVSEKFSSNLDAVDPSARKAYGAAIFQVADSSGELSDENKNAYYKTLATFATRMTHTEMGNKMDAVTEFMFINKTGTPTIVKFKDDIECGEYFAKRISHSQASKGRFKTGEFEVKDGKVTLLLNTSASLSQSPISRRS